jgi:hypothetical protein
MNDYDKKIIEEAEKLDAEVVPGPWAALIGPDGLIKDRERIFEQYRELLPALAKRLREISTENQALAEKLHGEPAELKLNAERWRLALHVIRASRHVARENTTERSGTWLGLRETLAFWDAFEALPPDPPLAAAKVAVK